MVTKVSVNMLEQKVVYNVFLTADILKFDCTDGTNIQLNLASLPALVPVTSMLTKLAAINAYIAAHP